MIALLIGGLQNYSRWAMPLGLVIAECKSAVAEDRDLIRGSVIVPVAPEVEGKTTPFPHHTRPASRHISRVWVFVMDSGKIGALSGVTVKID